MDKFHKIETAYRRIISAIPHPGSIPLIEELRKIEPRSMSGMPPVVWNHAEDFQVWDGYGNKWIDFTSSVVLTNAGHAHPKIGEAIRRQIDNKMWHNYCNPSEIRLQAVKVLLKILPSYLNKVFLLTTGSEAVECALKLMRLHGQKINKEKIHVLSYYGSFHGRTMGSQTAGGFLEQQEWMGLKPGGFHHIPFPECARCPWGKIEYERCGQECLELGLKQLRNNGLDEEMFAGVITETYQGPTVAFMPGDYVQALRDWAKRHKTLLVFDEIQAGFGRTGKWFGFEHYGVEADLICMGKGMTSSLPMSAVAGRGVILDLAEPGKMSSTHTGNPLCCAALMANVESIKNEGFIENAVRLEPVAYQALERLRRRFPEHVGSINGKGLVWAIYLLDPKTKQLNCNLARDITIRCMESGLLMLQTGRGTLKIAPPLCINKEALLEGIQVIEESLVECVETK